MIMRVSRPYGESYIIIIMGDAYEEWHVSFEAVDESTFIIDSVNGTAPTSLDQLFDLISALIVA